MKSQWPRPAGAERSSHSVSPAQTPAHGIKTQRKAFECLRHDSRSAAHTMQGFIELFATGALGPLSPAQEQSLAHLAQAATRIAELLEISLDLSEEARPLPASELERTRLSVLARNLVHSIARDHAELDISLELPDMEQELLTQLDPTLFGVVVRTLVQLLGEQGYRALDLRVSQTDLHTSLVLCPRPLELPGKLEHITQSMPARAAASADLEAMAAGFRNRDYLRLKRCESLLSRQRGRLLVAPDLTRIRVMLPTPRKER